MSHLVTIETQVKSEEAARRAAARLGLPEPVHGLHWMHGERKGLAIYLKDWHLPVVFGDDGKTYFDNYEGHWGDLNDLHRFLQHYAVEAARVEAEARGYPVTETVLGDGSIEVEILETY